ncbi:MAG: glycosyltransferase [Phycisphaerales bacterium]|nr:MAG: glycosyltransferase [Phycisphaerales bacterium]
MRILMLGWEFPPFIAGGLGVACYGLTKALDRHGHKILFILPKPVDRAGNASHVKMLGSDSPAPAAGTTRTNVMDVEGMPLHGFQNAIFRGVQASFSHSYPGFDPAKIAGVGATAGIGGVDLSAIQASDETAALLAQSFGGGLGGGSTSAGLAAGGPGVGYGSDLVGDSERYARLVVALARGESFDVVHAHDWLTFPAGVALSSLSRKPLIVHVHSTEFDRAGTNVNQRVYEIERAGMHHASRVIAVSQFTKAICVRRYGVSPAKVDVVYNGIERDHVQPREGDRIESGDRIVLFVGRITMQKGPEYFIAAAKRVLEKMSNVKFVLAGSGDMAVRMIELAASMGIGHKVLFTGFLRGRDVDRVYQMADCYVMPSVSEPFGIAALEAIKHDVPVILSKTSGASEVLTHVLKVDFWDIDEMANKILAVLRHPPLSQTLRQHGSFELHRLTWDGAAERCVASYSKAMGTTGPSVAAS